MGCYYSIKPVSALMYIIELFTTYEPCSTGPVPNRTDQSIRIVDRSKKSNFYGTSPRKEISQNKTIFFRRLVPNKTIYMRTGHKKGHKRYFYGGRSKKRYFVWGLDLDKVLFLRTGP